MSPRPDQDTGAVPLKRTGRKDSAGAPAPGAADSAPKEGAASAAPEPDPAPVGGAPAEPSAGAEPEAQLQGDLDELMATAAQRDEYLALAQRTQADFENYRKRMGREVGAAEARAITRVVKELLPALDNLERALGAAAEGDESLADGVRLVQSELLAALARVGIKPFSPEGEEFDPQLHEAISQQPVDGAEAGTVAEVYHAGYRLGETVIRPAGVVVAA